MITFFIFLCLIVMVIASVVSVMIKSIVKSAIALGITSAALSIVLFLMGAKWASVFELSVCAGLISVIFISCISLTFSGKKSLATQRDHQRRFVFLPFLLILAGVAMISVVIATNFSIVSPAESVIVTTATFQNVFWNLRQADVLGQIIIILTGAIGVVVLFKEGKK